MPQQIPALRRIKLLPLLTALTVYYISSPAKIFGQTDQKVSSTGQDKKSPQDNSALEMLGESNDPPVASNSGVSQAASGGDSLAQGARTASPLEPRSDVGQKLAENISAIQNYRLQPSQPAGAATIDPATMPAPKSPQAREVYARALAELNHPEAARQVVDEGLKLSPNDPGLLALKQALTPRIDTSHGLAALRKAINSWLPWKTDAGPDSGARSGVQYASAIRFGLPTQNRNTDENARFGSANGVSPALLAEKQGLLKLRMGDYSEAERFFTSKIKQYPYDWLAYRLRALARKNLKNPQGAFSDASAAIQLNRRDNRSYDVRALAEIDLGRNQDAISDAKIASTLEPRDADAWEARGLAEEKLGQGPAMLEDLKKAAELDPQYEDAYRQALQPHGENRGNGPASNAISGLSSIPNLSTWLLGLFVLVLAGLAWSSFRRALTTISATQQHQIPVPIAAAPHAAAGSVPVDGRMVVDHFEIVRKLGQGGMGEVFEGIDNILERKVALKKLRAEIAHEPRERRRFIREARTVAKLQHPNIVQIYTVLERPEELYLVFELVQGRTLDKHLAFRHGGDGMDPYEALGVLWQVGAALDHAHSQGIIHRDLKPANIMVKDKVVKVMDFGIARQVQEVLSTMSRGEVIGTPAYMAPEQERGESLKESDLYALGVCLYEMLTGIQPFPDYNSYELKMKKTYNPLSSANGSLSKKLDAFMDTALEPSPEGRFHSAREMMSVYQKAVTNG